MKCILSFLIGVLLLVGCEESGQPDFDATKVEKSIRTMFDDYHAAIEKEGLKGELFFLDSSAQFFWVPPGHDRALSFREVKSILEQNDKALLSAHFSWETLDIHALSKRIASYTGIIKGVMIDTSGNRSSYKMIESGTLIRRADGWKLLCGQSATLSN